MNKDIIIKCKELAAQIQSEALGYEAIIQLLEEVLADSLRERDELRKELNKLVRITVE